MINFYKRTNTFSPLYIYIANNCLVPLTCILANNFANNFVTKLNNRAFSSEGRKRKEVLISNEDEALKKGIGYSRDDIVVFFDNDKEKKQYKGFS